MTTSLRPNVPRSVGICFITLCLVSCAAASPRHTTHHVKPSRELFAISMQLATTLFDPDTHLLRRPGVAHAAGAYMVRESSWYALGLLARDGAGDRQTAAAILEAVLSQQYRDPTSKWYGTFKRSPEEPTPPPDAVAFKEYDPNWRHFIGTIFEIILLRFPDRVPSGLVARLYESIDLSIEGELHDGRLTENYSNIALIYGALWNFAATHNHNPQWQSASERWNQTVFDLFRLHNTFAEFNSPTYYGVDLYGLALWRNFGSTPAMRQMGRTMESTLWRDIADFYQPALRNIAGPYDRSYGMDMESYVSVTGVWLRSILPADRAPLPEHLTLSTDHIGDIFFAPQIVLLGAQMSPAVMRRFIHPAAVHLVERVIDTDRKATAFIGRDAIWGGEFTSSTRGVDAESQFHPATVQWRMTAGAIAWINVIQCPPIDVTANPTGLDLTTVHPGSITFRIAIGSVTPANVTESTWTLPGMTVHVLADHPTLSITPATLPTGSPALDVTYSNARHLTLSFTPTG